MCSDGSFFNFPLLITKRNFILISMRLDGLFRVFLGPGLNPKAHVWPFFDTRCVLSGQITGRGAKSRTLQLGAPRSPKEEVHN